MLEKYKATISGNRIEWEGEMPEGVKTRRRVGVYVTLIDESPDRLQPNGKRLVAILQTIAERGGIQSIDDPSEWQSEIRKDRPLPGRE